MIIFFFFYNIKSINRYFFLKWPLLVKNIILSFYIGGLWNINFNNFKGTRCILFLY